MYIYIYKFYCIIKIMYAVIQKHLFLLYYF